MADSILEGSTIPVYHEPERVKVTTEVTDRIGQKRTMRALRATLDNSLHEIKQVLNWRKIAIQMMNKNTSQVVVRKEENIDLKEARGVTSTRPDGKPDSDLW